MHKVVVILQYVLFGMELKLGIMEGTIGAKQ